MTYSAPQALNSFEDPAIAHLIDKARSLLPMLKEQAAEAEKLRRILPATFERLRESGLFRISQPRRWGGYELPPQVQFAVISTLAQACPSTAWVVANLGGHNGTLAAWSDQAQEDVWGKASEALVASSLIFTWAKAETAEGGYRISGKWPFSSGIDVSEWCIVAAAVKRPDGEERRFFLIPKKDYQIVDNWNVVGLCATGSNELTADDIFVPEHRSMRVLDIEARRAPGLIGNSGDVYKVAGTAGVLILMSVVYGAALGALNEFTEMLRVRRGQATGQGLASLVTMQMKVSEAASRLQAVKLLAAHHLDAFWADARASIESPEEKILECRRDAAFGARLSLEVVDLIMGATGGNGLKTSNAIQRLWRDAHSGAAQFALNWDVAATAFGRKAVDLPSGLPTFSGT